tara:strand:+ start:86 stop:259 length:174 start_codon:yes stop_codon:yes gene_type:complete
MKTNNKGENMSYPKVIKKDTLEVGDVVSWRGSFGSSGSKDAVVTSIQSNFLMVQKME